MIIKRGDIFYADLSGAIFSEQKGVRPVLIIQNNTGNKHSPTVIVAAITSKQTKSKLPTHVKLAPVGNLSEDSLILLEQIRTLDKSRLKEKVCHLDDETIKKVNKAIIISLALCSDYYE